MSPRRSFSRPLPGAPWTHSTTVSRNAVSVLPTPKRYSGSMALLNSPTGWLTIAKPTPGRSKPAVVSLSSPLPVRCELMSAGLSGSTVQRFRGKPPVKLTFEDEPPQGSTPDGAELCPFRTSWKRSLSSTSWGSGKPSTHKKRLRSKTPSQGSVESKEALKPEMNSDSRRPGEAPVSTGAVRLVAPAFCSLKMKLNAVTSSARSATRKASVVSPRPPERCRPKAP